MKTGVLGGGGDCPGFSAVIRAVFRKAGMGGDGVLGIFRGGKGRAEAGGDPLEVDVYRDAEVFLG